MFKRSTDSGLGRIRYLLLVALMGVQTACSTPPAIEREHVDETWDAYLSCIQYYYYVNQRLCDDVSTSNAYSFNQYSFLNSGYQQLGYGGARFRGAVKALTPYLEQAYKEYVEALPETEKAALAAQWRALVPQEQ